MVERTAGLLFTRADAQRRTLGYMRKAPAIPPALAMLATGLVTMQGTSHVAAAAPPGLTLPGVGTISGTTGATQALDAISADGTKITLWSDTDLVGNEATGPDPDVFVDNTVTGALTRVSVSNSGGEVDGDNTSAWISDDGRYVAFKSASAGFVAGDTNGTEDAFVRDTQAGTTTRVSVDDNGAEIAAGPDELAAALATGGRA